MTTKKTPAKKAAPKRTPSGLRKVSAAAPKAKAKAKPTNKAANGSARRRSPSPKAPSSQRRRVFSNNGWEARPYQQQAYDAMQTHDRALLIWHRRAGKDNFSLNFAKDRMDKEPGTYWHMFPLHSQARRAIWMGIDKKGQRFIDQAFPVDERVKVWQQDMMIEMQNGSTWQLLGSDYYDRLVGANTKGVVFSEWALCDPRAWEYIRPIIRENKGWVIFITTYRGRNHAYQMVQNLKDSPDWYVDVRTVEDTFDWDGNRILTDADIDAERRDGMVESLIQQEYYCNPMASATGAVYGDAVTRLDKQNRLGQYPYDPRYPVYAAWSFEYAPANISVVLVQPHDNRHRVIWSKSFMFTPFADALATIPYRVHRHVLHSEERDWTDVLENLRLQVEVTKPITEGKIATVTQNALELAEIDTTPQDQGNRENNENLVESLNGYSLREVDNDTYSTQSVMSKEIYLVRALETYGIWQHQENITTDVWHRPPDYTQRDRAVV